MTPDPEFYFDSQTHRKALAYLSYGLGQGEGFIVITGDIGAGKTTLVGHLMTSIDRVHIEVAQIVSSQLGAEDVLRMTAQQIGVPTEGLAKGDILSRIERHLVDIALSGRRSLLIVDEAQNLNSSALEELRMLSNFQLGEKCLLQIFLLGQPEFRARLNYAPELEQLRQRVIASHHLGPMNPEEVEPYIRHRMMRGGWTGNPAIAGDGYWAIYRQTNGLPRKINTLMSRVLLHGALDGLTSISAYDIEVVIADLLADASLVPEEEHDLVAPYMAQPYAPDLNDIPPSVPTPAPTPAPAPAPAPVASVIVPETSSMRILDEVKHFAQSQPAAPVTTSPKSQPEISASELSGPSRLIAGLQQQIDMLTAQAEEQDQALRRLLALLIDWSESGSPDAILGGIRGQGSR